MTQSEVLAPEAFRANFFEEGYVILRGFVPEGTLLSMEAHILGLCDQLDAGHSLGVAMPVFEKSLADKMRARDKLSKLFRLHREQPVFNQFCCADVLKPYLEALLGKDYDCFLSQFIFK